MGAPDAGQVARPKRKLPERVTSPGTERACKAIYAQVPKRRTSSINAHPSGCSASEREPQSVQSVPNSHTLPEPTEAPKPPSWQTVSLAQRHESKQTDISASAAFASASVAKLIPATT